MKRIKRYIEFIKENSSEWKEREIAIPLKDFFESFFPNKKKIDEDEKYVTYSHYDKQWDEKEQEYFWEKDMILKVDKSNPEITHYWEKTLTDRPLYKVREKDMTRDQELTIRSWTGTEKNPKYTSKYEGFEKGLAKFRSFLSDRKDGKLYHVLPNGDIVEMLPDEKMDEEYIEEIINYLLDTRNLDLIEIVKKQYEELDN